jgi:uncharacterized protein (TIGR02284 family)
MASTGENFTNILIELTEFVNDRRDGYKKAATDTDNPLFKKFYQELSDEQAALANQLQKAIEQSGSRFEMGADIVGEFYSPWREAKEKFVSSDEHTIVELNLDGEEWAQKAYSSALENKNLPEQVQQIVKKQQEVCLKNITRLTEMKASD